jgi:hypothetical protein
MELQAPLLDVNATLLRNRLRTEARPSNSARDIGGKSALGSLI